MGLLIALLLPASARAEGSAEVQTFLISINRLYENLEYERALDQISRAKQLAKGVEDEVVLSLYEGIILADLGRQGEAAAAFKSALYLQPDAKLPILVSPKVTKQVEGVRQQVKKELAPVLAKREEEERRKAEAEQQRLAQANPTPVQPAQSQAPQKEPEARPALSPSTTSTPSAEVSTRGNLRSRALLPAIAGGVLVAAGGVSFGLSKAEQSKLRDADPSLDSLQAARDSAARGKTYQTVGLGLLGAGVVGLGVAAGLYVVGAPATPVSLGVTTDGTSAFVYGRWP